MNTDYLVTGEVTKVRENGAVSGVGVLSSYSYDDLGNRTLVTFGNGASQAFSYDPVSRLASLTNNLSGTTNDLSATFAYNPASQITQTVRTGDTYAWTGHGSGSTAYASNGLNQQTSIGGSAATWDSKGNLTFEPQSGKTYAYSSENLLTSATGGVTLSYDPSLRLYQVAGAATTRFAYDGANAIAEYNASNALQRRYVFGPGIDEPIVQYEGTGTADRRFMSADERGSIISLTDSSGALLAINRYDEYGKPQSTNAGRFQYTGQKWISDLGLYDYKFRMYAPHLGIFPQTDPIGYGPSTNLYAYVLNDPINFMDPLGLIWVCVGVGSGPLNCGWRPQNPNEYVGLGGSRSSRELSRQGGRRDGVGRNKDQNKKQLRNSFTCADALTEPGIVRAAQLLGGSSIFVLGVTGGTGVWINQSTGTHGTFTTFGFGAGVAFGLSVSVQDFSSLRAFAGSSDSFTIGGGVGSGRASIGASYSQSWSDSGSGGGFSGDVGHLGAPNLTAQAAWTDTQISDCKPGWGSGE